MTGSFLHATCVSVDATGILLLGPSGSGKSDLALRLIDGGAKLVSDDQVQLHVQGEKLMASAPERIAGLIEARGVGIWKQSYLPECAVKLVVNLAPRAQIERMPDPAFFDCLGLQVPLLSLDAFDASVCAKIRLYVKGQQ